MTNPFHTHCSYPFNALRKRPESMIQGVGSSTIGLTTGTITVAPPSTTFEAVKSKANDLVGLTVF